MTFLLMAMTFAAQEVEFLKGSEAMPLLLAEPYATSHRPDAPPVAAPDFPLANPICQTGWSITQEYLDRRADGTIWRRTSIYRCIPQPKIEWKKRVNQLRRT